MSQNRTASAAVTMWGAWSVGVIVIALAAVGLLGAPALGHAVLAASFPAANQHLDELPDEVWFEFNEKMSPPAYVVVTAPDGTAMVDGDPVVAGTKVSQRLIADGPDGAYTMAYRAISVDGHPVTGEIEFSVGDVDPAATSEPRADPPDTTARPDPDTASDTASNTDRGAGSVLDGRRGLLVGGVAVVLFVAAGALWLLSRRAGP